MESSPSDYISFWDSIFGNLFVSNKSKRNFINYATDLIDNRLSVEYILESSNNFQLLKKTVLNQEQFEKFDFLTNLSFEEQLREFDIKI